VKYNWLIAVFVASALVAMLFFVLPPSDTEEPATPQDCALMALSLRGTELIEKWPNFPLLSTNANSSCDWQPLGISLSQTAIQSFPGEELRGHFRIGKPRYSRLWSRAVVEVVWWVNPEGAQAYNCKFHHNLKEWVFDLCEESWVA
jgi:hypothetical protein